MTEHDEIIVRVPKGWKGSVTVNAEDMVSLQHGDETLEHVLSDRDDETYEMDEDPLGDVPYGSSSADYDPFASVPADMLASRVIDGHGVKSVFHETPKENLNAIRRLVDSLHYAIRQSNPSAPLRVIEVGPWVGESTVAICQGIDNSIGGVVTCIDTFAGTPNGYLGDVVEKVGGPEKVQEMFLANVGEYYRNPVQLLKMSSMKAARDLNIGVGQLDLVFLDGCYEPIAIADDVRVWSELLSQTGILAGQLCGPNCQKAYEALKAVLAGLNVQLKFYEGTTVWAVMRSNMVLTEEPAVGT